MQTIEIQCGGCQRMMAISVDHLGTQVHCPHCQTVVQAPDRDSTIEMQPAERDEAESIFTEPEITDAIVGPASQPRVEMPGNDATENLAAAEPPATIAYDPPGAASAPAPGSAANLVLERPRSERASDSDRRHTAAGPAAALAGPLSEESTLPRDLSIARRPVSRRSSILMPTLLIFLVPYSILATVFIVLLMTRQKEDPMQRLPDPEPAPKSKKGPPRTVERTKHDTKLPPQLITSLRQPIQVGDIEITPLEVAHTPDGRFTLHLKARNLTKNLAFVPISPIFLNVPKDLKDVKEFKDLSEPKVRDMPYTFLHNEDMSVRLYGGYLNYVTAKGESEFGLDGELLPGDEGFILITTNEDHRDARVRKVLHASDKLLWRVQVRRGLVEVSGESQPKSATAVIGVEFRAGEIKVESS